MKLTLPKWLRKDSLSLPDWARVADQQKDAISVIIDVDTDGAMKEWLKLLGAPTPPDQYWVECAYQCAKLDLQSAIAGTAHDPRTAGKSAQFNFSRAPQWALSNFAPGKGTAAATQGREAREHYRRVRGKLPF